MEIVPAPRPVESGGEDYSEDEDSEAEESEGPSGLEFVMKNGGVLATLIGMSYLGQEVTSQDLPRMRQTMKELAGHWDLFKRAPVYRYISVELVDKRKVQTTGIPYKKENLDKRPTVTVADITSLLEVECQGVGSQESRPQLAAEIVRNLRRLDVLDIYGNIDPKKLEENLPYVEHTRLVPNEHNSVKKRQQMEESGGWFSGSKGADCHTAKTFYYLTKGVEGITETNQETVEKKLIEFLNQKMETYRVKKAVVTPEGLQYKTSRESSNVQAARGDDRLLAFLQQENALNGGEKGADNDTVLHLSTRVRNTRAAALFIQRNPELLGAENDKGERPIDFIFESGLEALYTLTGAHLSTIKLNKEGISPVYFAIGTYLELASRLFYEGHDKIPSDIKEKLEGPIRYYFQHMPKMGHIPLSALVDPKWLQMDTVVEQNTTGHHPYHPMAWGYTGLMMHKWEKGKDEPIHRVCIVFEHEKRVVLGLVKMLLDAKDVIYFQDAGSLQIIGLLYAIHHEAFELLLPALEQRDSLALDMLRGAQNYGQFECLERVLEKRGGLAGLVEREPQRVAEILVKTIEGNAFGKTDFFIRNSGLFINCLSQKDKEGVPYVFKWVTQADESTLETFKSYVRAASYLQTEAGDSLGLYLVKRHKDREADLEVLKKKWPALRSYLKWAAPNQKGESLWTCVLGEMKSKWKLEAFFSSVIGTAEELQSLADQLLHHSDGLKEEKMKELWDLLLQKGLDLNQTVAGKTVVDRALEQRDIRTINLHAKIIKWLRDEKGGCVAYYSTPEARAALLPNYRDIF